MAHRRPTGHRTCSRPRSVGGLWVSGPIVHVPWCPYRPNGSGRAGRPTERARESTASQRGERPNVKLRKATKAAPFETGLPSMDLTPSETTRTAPSPSRPPISRRPPSEVTDHREAVEVLRQMMNAVDQQLSADGTPIAPRRRRRRDGSNGAGARRRIAGRRGAAADAIGARPMLGEILEAKGILTHEQINEALLELVSTGKRLGAFLVDAGLIDEQVLVGRARRAVRPPRRRSAPRGPEPRRHRHGEREEGTRAVGDPVPVQRAPDRDRRRRPDRARTRCRRSPSSPAARSRCCSRRSPTSAARSRRATRPPRRSTKRSGPSRRSRSSASSTRRPRRSSTRTRRSCRS